jgi:hypothetical protein
MFEGIRHKINVFKYAMLMAELEIVKKMQKEEE